MILDTAFWLRMIGTLAVESLAVVGVAWIAERFVRSGIWRRTIWQCCIVGLLTLVASDLSGFGRGAASFLFRKAPGPTPAAASVTLTVGTATPVSQVIPAAANTLEVAPAPVLPKPSRSWIGLVWIAGTSVILLRVACAQGALMLIRLRRSAVADAELAGRAADIALRFRGGKSPILLEAPGLGTPIAFGLLRPCIGLPENFTAQFNAVQQKAMLAHEMAHLAGRDPLWYLVADIIAAIGWWNPLVWIARSALHRSCELAADEATLIVDNGPGSLAECLVSLARQSTRPRHWALAGVEGDGFKSILGQRVERLLELGDQGGAGRGRVLTVRRWPFSILRLGLATGMAALLILTAGWIQGQSVAAEKTLGASVRESWKASPVASMMLAVSTPASDKKKATDIPVAPASKEVLAAVTNIENVVATNIEKIVAPDSGPVAFFSKTWRLDIGQLVAALGKFDPTFTNTEKEITGTPADSAILKRSHEAIRAYIKTAGVNFDRPGTALVAKAHRGFVSLRATQQEVEKVDALLHPLAVTAPFQLVLETVCVDMDRDALGGVGLGWMIGSGANPDDSTGRKISENYAILTSRRMKETQDAMASHGVIRAISKATTLSGRQLHLGYGDYHTNADGRVMFDGRALDALVNVGPNGQTVRMLTILDVAARMRPLDNVSRTQIEHATEAELYDGQTLVFLQSIDEKKVALAFITPTVIDPVGNRLNAPEDLPKPERIMRLQPSRPTSSSLFPPVPNTIAPYTLPKSTVIVPTTPPQMHAGLKVGEKEQQLIIRNFGINRALDDEPKLALKNTTNVVKTTHERVKAALDEEGLRFDPPRSLLCNDRNGIIYVRTTPEEMQRVEKVVKRLNTPPPQLTIEARFLEIEDEDTTKPAFDWLLQKLDAKPARTAVAERVASGEVLGISTNQQFKTLTNQVVAKLSAILSEQQFMAASDAVSQQKHINLLMLPKVTVLSGRKTTLSGADYYYPAKHGSRIVEPNPVGAGMEILPQILADGTVELDVVSTDTSREAKKLRLRQIHHRAIVRDGETMMLCGLIDSKLKHPKNILVFVTPTIVDLAGRRLASIQ